MKKIFLFLIFSLLPAVAVAQKARIKGIVLDEFKNPIENVGIAVDDLGTTTNSNGFYLLEIPANKKVSLTFSHVSFKNYKVSVTLKPNEDFEFNPVLNARVEEIGEVVVTGNRKKRIEGVTTIDPVIIRTIPGEGSGTLQGAVKTAGAGHQQHPVYR